MINIFLNMFLRFVTVIGTLMFIIGGEASADHATLLSSSLFLGGGFLMWLTQDAWFD